MNDFGEVLNRQLLNEINGFEQRAAELEHQKGPLHEEIDRLTRLLDNLSSAEGDSGTPGTLDFLLALNDRNKNLKNDRNRQSAFEQNLSIIEEQLQEGQLKTEELTEAQSLVIETIERFFIPNEAYYDTDSLSYLRNVFIDNGELTNTDLAAALIKQIEKRFDYEQYQAFNQKLQHWTSQLTADPTLTVPEKVKQELTEEAERLDWNRYEKLKQSEAVEDIYNIVEKVNILLGTEKVSLDDALEVMPGLSYTTDINEVKRLIGLDSSMQIPASKVPELYAGYTKANMQTVSDEDIFELIRGMDFVMKSGMVLKYKALIGSKETPEEVLTITGLVYLLRKLNTECADINPESETVQTISSFNIEDNIPANWKTVRGINILKLLELSRDDEALRRFTKGLVVLLPDEKSTGHIEQGTETRPNLDSISMNALMVVYPRLNTLLRIDPGAKVQKKYEAIARLIPGFQQDVDRDYFFHKKSVYITRSGFIKIANYCREVAAARGNIAEDPRLVNYYRYYSQLETDDPDDLFQCVLTTFNSKERYKTDPYYLVWQELLTIDPNEQTSGELILSNRTIEGIIRNVLSSEDPNLLEIELAETLISVCKTDLAKRLKRCPSLYAYDAIRFVRDEIYKIKGITEGHPQYSLLSSFEILAGRIQTDPILEKLTTADFIDTYLAAERGNWVYPNAELFEGFGIEGEEKDEGLRKILKDCRFREGIDFKIVLDRKTNLPVVQVSHSLRDSLLEIIGSAQTEDQDINEKLLRLAASLKSRVSKPIPSADQEVSFEQAVGDGSASPEDIETAEETEILAVGINVKESLENLSPDLADVETLSLVFSDAIDQGRRIYEELGTRFIETYFQVKPKTKKTDYTAILLLDGITEQVAAENYALGWDSLRKVHNTTLTFIAEGVIENTAYETLTLNDLINLLNLDEGALHSVFGVPKFPDRGGFETILTKMRDKLGADEFIKFGNRPLSEFIDVETVKQEMANLLGADLEALTSLAEDQELEEEERPNPYEVKVDPELISERNFRLITKALLNPAFIDTLGDRDDVCKYLKIDPDILDSYVLSEEEIIELRDFLNNSDQNSLDNLAYQLGIDPATQVVGCLLYTVLHEESHKNNLFKIFETELENIPLEEELKRPDLISLLEALDAKKGNFLADGARKVIRALTLDTEISTSKSNAKDENGLWKLHPDQTRFAIKILSHALSTFSDDDLAAMGIIIIGSKSEERIKGRFKVIAEKIVNLICTKEGIIPHSFTTGKILASGNRKIQSLHGKDHNNGEGILDPSSYENIWYYIIRSKKVKISTWILDIKGVQKRRIVLSKIK